MLFFRQSEALARARVVVTGAGVVTSLGVGWNANFEGFRVGRRQFRPVTLFDVSRQRAKMAAEVDLPASIPTGRLSERQARRLDRAGKLLFLACQEACQQARLEGARPMPIVLGTTSGGMGLGEVYYRRAIQCPRSPRGQPSRLLNYLAESQAIALAQGFGFGGPLLIIANACASGANAIGQAACWIRCGRADIVLTGGYDALNEMVFAGFDSLQALTTTQCRPFDAGRDGLALGEGAAVLILESQEHAHRRGATVLAELAGYGAATDIFHLTQPQSDGEAAFRSMRAATEDAGISPGQVDYINAHGTGTPLNDAAEAVAIGRWAGEAAGAIPVSSTKAGIGHLLGAAGAVEAVVCLMALQGQWLPPSVGIQTLDSLCSFPLVRKAREAKVEYVLTNSFGFGGANASLIFRKA